MSGGIPEAQSLAINGCSPELELGGRRNVNPPQTRESTRQLLTDRQPVRLEDFKVLVDGEDAVAILVGGLEGVLQDLALLGADVVLRVVRVGLVPLPDGACGVYRHGGVVVRTSG